MKMTIYFLNASKLSHWIYKKINNQKRTHTLTYISMPLISIFRNCLCSTEKRKKSNLYIVKIISRIYTHKERGIAAFNRSSKTPFFIMSLGYRSFSNWSGGVRTPRAFQLGFDSRIMEPHFTPRLCCTISIRHDSLKLFYKERGLSSIKHVTRINEGLISRF